MSTEPVWPVLDARSLPRNCAGSGGGGGSARRATWDVTGLLRALRGNPVAAARVARVFLDECPQVAQRLRDAVRDGDRASLQRQTHRLKGNAGILRASEVCEAARRLEQIAGGDDLGPAEQHLRVLEQHLESLCDAIGWFLKSAGDSPPP